MAQRRGSVKDGEKEKEKGAKCGICTKGVGDKESGIQCEFAPKVLETKNQVYSVNCANSGGMPVV